MNNKAITQDWKLKSQRGGLIVTLMQQRKVGEKNET